MKIKGSRSGFTLIELLIVIGIIILIATMTIPFVSAFVRGQGLTQAGSTVNGAFVKAKQQAVSTRIKHKLIFDLTSKTMQLRKYDESTSDYTILVGEEISLPKQIEFEKAPNDGANYYAIFRGDGTIDFPGADQTLADPPTTASSDIVLKRGSEVKKCMIDIRKNVGRITFVVDEPS